MSERDESARGRKRSDVFVFIVRLLRCCFGLFGSIRLFRGFRGSRAIRLVLLLLCIFFFVFFVSSLSKLEPVRFWRVGSFREPGRIANGRGQGDYDLDIVDDSPPGHHVVFVCRASSQPPGQGHRQTTRVTSNPLSLRCGSSGCHCPKTLGGPAP